MVDIVDESHKATIIAFAKEGLISQKTALKVIGRYKSALERLDVYCSAKTILPLTRMVRPII